VPRFIDAPPAPRLIAKCRYGLSIWAYLLLQKYEYHQPLNRVLKQLAASRISLASGTVTDGFEKLLTLLLPVYDAIVEHNLSEKHWHADETSWKVFEEIEGKKNNRWYMWLFRGKESVVYKICKSRSSEELMKHFGENHPGGLLNVDRYSAYKAIAKTGLFLLAFCWAHVRRDFLTYAKGYPQQEEWSLSWVGLIANLYHINNQRLQHEQNSKAFRQYQEELEIAIRVTRERIDKELIDDKLLSSAKKLIKSLDTHWDGLTIFVDTPDIPMDNNKAENSLRHGVLGRNGYYGSGAVWSSALTAVMFTLFRTFSIWGIHLHTWLLAYFHECASRGGQPPEDISKFLPWNMSEEQKARLSQPPVGENPFST
jgi:transposase